MPENIVDYLARQYHVDFYQADLSLDAKRKLVKNSIIWHRHKGTKWAVEQVVSTVFEHPAHVEEWFEYGGDPYKFKITASGFENIQQLVSAIKTVKILDRISTASMSMLIQTMQVLIAMLALLIRLAADHVSDCHRRMTSNRLHTLARHINRPGGCVSGYQHRRLWNHNHMQASCVW